MKKKFATFLLVGLFGLFGLVGFLASPASAQDCETTPTAQLCSEEVTTELTGEFMSIISSNVLIVVGLIALAVAIPIVIRLVRSAASKIRA